MDEKDFMKLAIDNLYIINKKGDSFNFCKTKTKSKSKKEDPKPVELSELYIGNKWQSGGMSGGSCYDTSEHCYYPMRAEEEPEFADLDKLLNLVCPNITYLKYKELNKNLIKFDSYEEYEYYGNYTVYSLKLINLRECYDKLKSMDLV